MARAAASLVSKRLEGASRVRTDRRERQIVRILTLLHVLSQGGTPSAHRLAAEFGTRRETIYRDLRVLQDAGYPVVGDDRGRLSHPRLLSSGVPAIQFSPAELEALHSAVEQVEVLLPDTGLLDTAKVKLKALLYLKQNSEPFTGSELFESWTCGAKRYCSDRGHIALIVEAILRRRRCHVVYKKPSSANSKNYEFDPYRLLLVDNGLYVVGRVPKYEGVATLSVDRLLSVTITFIDFEVDPAFDPKKCRQQAFGVSWQDPEQIVLRFCAGQAPYVRERTWHPTQQFASLPDGRLEMSFHAGGPFEIRRWILGWGDAVEVISPDSLRKEIGRVAESTLSFYNNPQT